MSFNNKIITIATIMYLIGAAESVRVKLLHTVTCELIINMLMRYIQYTILTLFQFTGGYNIAGGFGWGLGVLKVLYIRNVTV